MTRLPVGVCAHLDGEERTAERVSSQYCVLTVSRHLTIVIRNYELFFVILYFSFLILKLFLKSDIFTWKFVAKQKVFFSLSVCVWPQAALQAGLGRIVSNAVTAVMEECVTLQVATVPAVWAGQVNTATEVTTILYLVFFNAANLKKKKLTSASTYYYIVAP